MQRKVWITMGANSKVMVLYETLINDWMSLFKVKGWIDMAFS